MTRRRFLACAFCGAPLVMAADGFAIEPEWVKVRTVRLTKSRPTCRFVQFSDLHHKGDRAYLNPLQIPES